MATSVAAKPKRTIDEPASGHLKWVPCQKAEWVLRKLSLTWEIKRVQYANVDWSATNENLGRIDRNMSPERIEEYAEFMLNGAEFPRPIIIERNNRATIIAGVHRSHSAVKIGQTHFDAYLIVPCPDELLVKYVAELTNRIEGFRTDKNHGMERAIDLVVNHGADPQEASDILCVSKDSLLSRIRIMKRKQELAERGYTGALPDTAIDKLAPMQSNAKVMCAIATLADDFRLTSTNVHDIAKQASQAKTEAQQLAIVEKHEAELRRICNPAKATVTRVVVSNRTKFLKAFRNLAMVVQDGSETSGLNFDKGSDEFRSIQSEYHDLRSRLDAIFHAV